MMVRASTLKGSRLFIGGGAKALSKALIETWRRRADPTIGRPLDGTRDSWGDPEVPASPSASSHRMINGSACVADFNKMCDISSLQLCLDQGPSATWPGRKRYVA